MRRTMMIGAAVAALGLAGGGVVLAQSMGEGMMRGGEGMMMERGMHGMGAGAMFDRLDADGDGRVTAAEIEAFRDGLFAEIDADGNGEISRQEFVDHAAARAAERAGAMFDRWDTDGDGILSRDAIEARRGSGWDAERLMRRFDADGDGAITRDEIATMRERWMERRGARMGRHGGGSGHMMDGHGGHANDDG